MNKMKKIKYLLHFLCVINCLIDYEEKINRKVLKMAFIEISLVIIGTIIGAGFASGKEISLFFARYGMAGLIGILLTVLIIGLIIYKTLKESLENGISSYSDLLIFKKVKHTNLINNCVNIFVLATFIIMVAGFRSYIKEITGSDALMLTIIFSFICYLVFNKKVTGIINSNKYLVPILIILILTIAVSYNISATNDINENREFIGNPFVSSIIYAGYNSIIITPVIISLAKKIKDKKDCKKVAILSMTLISFLFFSIFITLIKGGEMCQNAEFPMLNISKQIGGNIYSEIYSVIIIISIFTSAISSGYAYLNSKKREMKNYKITSAIICSIAVLSSTIGFANLVQYLYPIFGIIGIILAITI